MNYLSNSNDSSSLPQASSDRLDGYLKDNFNISFIDCKCCCNASKQISVCQNGSLEFMRDIQEYMHTPEYRLNCQCNCGDNQQNNTTMKFGVNLTPTNDLK